MRMPLRKGKKRGRIEIQPRCQLNDCYAKAEGMAMLSVNDGTAGKLSVLLTFINLSGQKQPLPAF